jgi:ubiquinone/menaquinone biosynthesis C-methylase UbiE
MSKKQYRSYDGFGVDVAEQRTDDLDKKALLHLEGKTSAKLLDLGCGALGFSKRAASADVSVLAIDRENFLSSMPPQDLPIEFRQGDVRNLADILSGDTVTDALMQRCFHYLEFEEGKKLLGYLRRVVSDKLFISVTGIDSNIGEVYFGKGKSLENRFDFLDSTGKSTFEINSQICLYTEAEFKELLTETGWQIDEFWVSAFKNIKAVCSHGR